MVVGTKGLEPLIFRLSAERFAEIKLCSVKIGRRSRNLTCRFTEYEPVEPTLLHSCIIKKTGGEGEIRTHIVLFTRQTLWFPLSYSAMSIGDFRFGISDLFQSQIDNRKSEIELVAVTGLEPVIFGL